MTIARNALLFSAALALTTSALQAQDAGGPPQGAGRRGGQGAPGQGGGFGGGAGRGGNMTRGTVTAVNGATITVKTAAGATESVITTDNTRIRRDGEAATVSAVKPGDEIGAMGMPDEAHAVHALMVIDVSAAKVAETKANLGKTYIAGRITAINETQLTVMRSDKVSQTINLDETTSIHRGGRIDTAALGLDGLLGGGAGGGMMGGMGGGGPMGGMGGGPTGGGRGGDAQGQRPGNNGGPGGPGNNGAARGPRPGAGNDAGEAITLADVKVGDTIAGTGSVKGGSFVPTDLHITMERRGPGGPGGPGGPPPQQ